MIVSILQASSVEAGSIHLEQRNLAVRDLIEVLKTTCVVPAGKQVELVWHCADELPALMTDPEKLKQILEHLIDNAIKFTNRGRIVISAYLTTDGGAVEFAVADTGVGIARKSFSNVFEMFRQSDSSITRSHGGVGLGLYLAKKFVDLWPVRLKSNKVNEGSIFTVTLPRNL
jgi:signal transduction histidine kinase